MSDGVDKLVVLVVAEGDKRIAFTGIARGAGPDPELFGDGDPRQSREPDAKQNPSRYGLSFFYLQLQSFHFANNHRIAQQHSSLSVGIPELP